MKHSKTSKRKEGEVDQAKLRNEFKGRITDYGQTQEQIDAAELHRQTAALALQKYRERLAQDK